MHIVLRQVLRARVLLFAGWTLWLLAAGYTTRFVVSAHDRLAEYGASRMLIERQSRDLQLSERLNGLLRGSLDAVEATALFQADQLDRLDTTGVMSAAVLDSGETIAAAAIRSTSTGLGAIYALSEGPRDPASLRALGRMWGLINTRAAMVEKFAVTYRREGPGRAAAEFSAVRPWVPNQTKADALSMLWSRTVEADREAIALRLAEERAGALSTSFIRGLWLSMFCGAYCFGFMTAAFLRWDRRRVSHPPSSVPALPA